MSKKSTTHSSYDEYLKWKNGESSEEEKKVNTHTSYDEYLKWRGDQQKASYDWYSQPESKRSDILSRYAQQAAFDTKYDGMSYADRAAALEQLKINLKNMPSPEQGAEYQYLKDNLLGAEEAQRYANMTREERDAAITKLRAAQAGVVNTDPLHPRTAIEDAQARQAANDAMKEYAGLEYYLANYDPTMQARTRLADYGAQKEDVGEFEYNNRQKLGGFYSDLLTGGATRLFGNKEQNAAYDAYKSGKESIAEYEARQKAYDEAIVRLGITRPEEYEELVKKGYGGEATEEQLAKSILNNPASNAVPLLSSLRQYTSRGDTLANYMYPQENAMFYALLGKGDIEGAGDYVNSLEKQLIQRAEQAQVEAKAESYKNDGANGFVRMIGDTLVSIPENMIGSVPALLDEVGQYVTTGEYDPYKSPDTQDVRSARQTRAAGSQYVGDITNHASIGGIEIAPLIYNAGVSALESAAGGYLGKMLQTTAFINNAGKAAEWLGKNTYIFMMGSGAAQARAEELYQRGASDKQILIGSLTAGINEALFEHFSLENIIDTDKFASYAARVLSQAGIEGSEEIATTLANQLADSITLGNVSDYNEAVRKYLADNPDMDYKTAQKLAAQDAFTGLLEDGLAGMLSGFSAVNIYDAANNVSYNRQNKAIGKNISSNYQAENTVKQGLEADENSEAYKLAKNIDERQKAGKKVSNKALGELARTLDTELTEKSGNALEKASEYRREAAAAETVENALKENGATDEEVSDLAPLVSKSILGEELTDAEQAKIDNNTAAVRYMDEVGSKTSEISGETGLQQLALRVNATTRGTGSTKASDRLREGALDKVFETAMRNELKPAKLSDNEIGKANETSYKVSTTGKTTYNGKAVNIDDIIEIGDGDALVTLDNGETAKLSEIEFADKGEAVAWQTITSIDGITPKAASELIAQYKNKPANVTAGVWARGIAEGYEIGRSGKLGTKEFPKAEASAKYLSNIGNDARRISETVGRQDARFERHKEAIEVDRKNVNNKNVNDAADTLDKMGRKYKIVEGIDGDGYIEKDGTIVLNKDAKDPIGFVLKHELTHYAETSKDYDGFVKAVKGSRAFAAWIDKQSLKDGTQLQQEADYLRRIKDRYRRHGVTLTNTEAHREMIANFVGDTLFNENGVGLDGLVNGMNAADRNAVMRFLTKLADFFRKHFTKKGETAYLEHFFSQLQNTATGERTDEKTYHFAGINDSGIEVYETSEATKKLPWRERKKRYLDLLKNEYRGRTAKFVRNGHTYYAQFDLKNASKAVYGDDRSSDDGRDALVNVGADGDIFTLVENSKYDRSSPNHKNKTEADYFDYFVKTVQIDGNVFDLVADVEKNYNESDGYLYTLALRDNNSIGPSPAKEQKTTPLKSQDNDPSAHSIPESAENVKRSDEKYLAAVNSGDMETAQRMVDEAAKAAGYTIRGWHGTTNYFTIFDRAKSNPEGDFGSGFYFTTSRDDVEENYASNEGPDLTNKIEHLADMLENEEAYQDMTYDERKEIARKRLSEGEPRVISAALKSENPVVIGNSRSMKETYLDFSEEYDEEADEYGEPEGKLVDFVEALREIASEYVWRESDLDRINTIYDEAGYGDMSAEDAAKWAKNVLAEIELTDDEGNLIGNEIVRQAFENIGFDAIIDNTVGEKFRRMNGVYGDTTHIIVFSSNQVKMTDPVTYDDKGNVIPLSERFNEGNEDIRWSIPETADELSREWVEKGKKYGTFDPGEKNTTGIMTPQQVDDKTRVERAVRTILGDGTLSDEYIYELGKETLLGKRSYEVESDEYAKEYLENATQQELEARVTKVLGNRNLQAGKLDVAAASYLIKQAIADGDTKKALEMEADLSAMLTHAGQFIQGWRLFKQMTPFGKLMTLQRAARMTNEEVRPGGRKATIDENLAMLLLEAKTEKEQQEAADNITADVAAQLDSSWLEKWNAWRYMSMLINPRTHARNIIGNAIFVPAVYLKDIIATGFEKIPMFRNALNADKRHAVKVKKEYADFAKFFVKDANVERDLKGGWGSFNRGVALEKAVFKGKFESFRKSMMGLLEKEDMWFKNIHYKHAFASYLQAQRVDTKSLSTNLKQNSKDAQNLIMRAHEYAVSEAFKNTYNDANAFSKMMNDLGRKHAISRFLVDSVVPFRKTPANIVKRGVEYSPIGLLTSISKGAIDYARTEKVKKQYENGEISRAEYNKYMSTKGFDGNKFIEKLASGLTGTGIFLLGVLLRSMGVLHGRARDDKDKYLRQLGRQDYSAELFGGTFSIDWAAPMNLPLFMGVELMDLLADTKEGAPIGPSTFTKPMSQFLQPIINLSMLEGVQNAIESVSYSNEGEEVSDFAEAVAASYFTQAMPTFLGAAARIADEKKRAYYTTNHASVDKFVQKVWNDFRAKIPAGYAIGGAIAKPPAIDVWGREISSGGMAQRLIENLVSPGYWKNVNYTDVDKEVLRVYDTTKDNSVIPSKPEKYIEISGEKKYLDEWEYCEYSVQKGTYSYGYIADALKNSKYKNLSDDQKAEVIKDLYSYAKAKAKDKVSDYDISSINTYKSAYKYEQSGGSVADFYIDKEKSK